MSAGTASAGLLDELAEQLNGMDAQEVEDSTSMLVEKGKYHAVLDDADDSVVSNGGNKGIELAFTLLGGRKPGKKVSHTLYTAGGDAEKTKKMLTQINLFALRLGIATKDADGKILITKGKSFRDAIGNECILDVIVDSGVSQKTGKPWEANAVKFCGIFSLGDEKARQGAHLAGEAAVKAAAEKRQKDDLSEIEV